MQRIFVKILSAVVECIIIRSAICQNFMTLFIVLNKDKECVST